MYFFKLGGYRNIFYTPTPYTKKIVLGGYKNDVTGMIHLLFNQLTIYCIFLNLGGIEIFLYPHPLTQKIVFGGRGYKKNDVTEMIHLLTFQSIKSVLYFFLILGGYRNTFYTSTSYTKKLCKGGIKNDVTEMIHLDWGWGLFFKQVFINQT